MLFWFTFRNREACSWIFWYLFFFHTLHHMKRASCGFTFVLIMCFSFRNSYKKLQFFFTCLQNSLSTYKFLVSKFLWFLTFWLIYFIFDFSFQYLVFLFPNFKSYFECYDHIWHFFPSRCIDIGRVKKINSIFSTS